MAKKTWQPTLASERLTPTERLRLLRERAGKVVQIIPHIFEGGYWGVPDSAWLENHFEPIRSHFEDFANGGDSHDLVDACVELAREAESRGILKPGSLSRYWIAWLANEAEQIRKSSSHASYSVDYDF